MRRHIGLPLQDVVYCFEPMRLIELIGPIRLAKLWCFRNIIPEITEEKDLIFSLIFCGSRKTLAKNLCSSAVRDILFVWLD